MLTEHKLASGMRFWTQRPEAGGPRPAIFLLHERYGPVTHSFRLLEKMAGEGYVACMPDLFHRFEGDRGPLERAETRFDPTDADSIADVDEAVAHLRTLDFVDFSSIGMAGFCASGRTPLVYAASRRDLKGIAVFHGGAYPRDYDPVYPGQKTVADYIPRLTCPLLGGFGEADPAVPLENVRRLRNELEQHRKSYRIRIFPGAPHAWMDTDRPSYRPKEADEAWRMMLDFFREMFQGGWDQGRALWQFESNVAVDYDHAKLQRVERR